MHRLAAVAGGRGVRADEDEVEERSGDRARPHGDPRVLGRVVTAEERRRMPREVAGRPHPGGVVAADEGEPGGRREDADVAPGLEEDRIAHRIGVGDAGGMRQRLAGQSEGAAGAVLSCERRDESGAGDVAVDAVAVVVDEQRVGVVDGTGVDVRVAVVAVAAAGGVGVEVEIEAFVDLRVAVVVDGVARLGRRSVDRREGVVAVAPHADADRRGGGAEVVGVGVAQAAEQRVERRGAREGGAGAVVAVAVVGDVVGRRGAARGARRRISKAVGVGIEEPGRSHRRHDRRPDARAAALEAVGEDQLDAVGEARGVICGPGRGAGCGTGCGAVQQFRDEGEDQAAHVALPETGFGEGHQGSFTKANGPASGMWSPNSNRLPRDVEGDYTSWRKKRGPGGLSPGPRRSLPCRA